MITSTTNPRMKQILKLQKSHKAREEQKVFLVEGPRMFFEVPADRLSEVYVTAGFEEKYRDSLYGYSYERISDAVCRHISDTKTPQGVIAVVRQSGITIDRLLSREEHPLFLLLENLQDPGNLGTIFRTAEAAGVTGIIMNRETVDPYNPKVIRSTMGTIFRVPFVVTEDLEKTVRRMKERQITVYAAHLAGTLFYEQNYIGGSAFLIGNEGKGLTEGISGLADRRIRIPMKGRVESLNAAAAATVLVYEAARQRGWD